MYGHNYMLSFQVQTSTNIKVVIVVILVTVSNLIARYYAGWNSSVKISWIRVTASYY